MKRTLKKRAVAIGGGTGLPIVLRALRDLPVDIVAIVTMADDGGSSGKLREELGILPPGDVRNCLVALAEDEGSELARLMSYRFPVGRTLGEHSLGNFIIAGMTDYKDGFTAAIDSLSKMLGVRGAVMPSTTSPVTLFADIGSDSFLAGQALIARTESIRQVHLEPAGAPVYSPAAEAVEMADLILIGPGSLFTSLIPNLLILGLTDAILRSKARKIFILNTMNMRNETFGMSGEEYIDALIRHTAPGIIDTVLVNDNPIATQTNGEDGGNVVAVAANIEALKQRGLKVLTADLVDESAPTRHDPLKIRKFMKEFLEREQA